MDYKIIYDGTMFISFKHGELFLWEGDVYMKIIETSLEGGETANAVNLSLGILVYFTDTVSVKAVETVEEIKFMVK